MLIPIVILVFPMERPSDILRSVVSQDEGVVLLVLAGIVLAGHAFRTPWQLHRLYQRGRSAVALGGVRLARWAAFGWVAYVLWNHADPSVTGIYRFFYLVMASAVFTVTTPVLTWILGAGSYRVDILERHNPAAAFLHAGAVLAMGLIFGGCLWGEADPDGDDEGGWWIPMGFLAAGWATLMVATALFRWREPHLNSRTIRQDRITSDGRAAALYTVSAAIPITQAVAGDFHGWRHGLLGVGAIVLLLAIREVFGHVQQRWVTVLGRGTRRWESTTYIVTGILYGLLQSHLGDRLMPTP
jgi:hypothetical protein